MEREYTKWGKEATAKVLMYLENDWIDEKRMDSPSYMDELQRLEGVWKSCKQKIFREHMRELVEAHKSKKNKQGELPVAVPHSPARVPRPSTPFGSPSLLPFGSPAAGAVLDMLTRQASDRTLNVTLVAGNMELDNSQNKTVNQGDNKEVLAEVKAQHKATRDLVSKEANTTRTTVEALETFLQKTKAPIATNDLLSLFTDLGESEQRKLLSKLVRHVLASTRAGASVLVEGIQENLENALDTLRALWKGELVLPDYVALDLEALTEGGDVFDILAGNVVHYQGCAVNLSDCDLVPGYSRSDEVPRWVFTSQGMPKNFMHVLELTYKGQDDGAGDDDAVVEFHTVEPQYALPALTIVLVAAIKYPKAALRKATVNSWTSTGAVKVPLDLHGLLGMAKGPAVTLEFVKAEMTKDQLGTLGRLGAQWTVVFDRCQFSDHDEALFGPTAIPKSLAFVDSEVNYDILAKAVRSFRVGSLMIKDPAFTPTLVEDLQGLIAAAAVSGTPVLIACRNETLRTRVGSPGHFVDDQTSVETVCTLRRPLFGVLDDSEATTVYEHEDGSLVYVSKHLFGHVFKAKVAGTATGLCKNCLKNCGEGKPQRCHHFA